MKKKFELQNLIRKKKLILFHLLDININQQEKKIGSNTKRKKKIIHIFDVSTVMDVWMLRCVNFNPSFSSPLPTRQVLWYWKSDKIHAKISLIWIKLVSFEDILMAHITYSFWFDVEWKAFIFLNFSVGNYMIIWIIDFCWFFGFHLLFILEFFNIFII